MNNRPLLVVIMDGFGITKDNYGNAISMANTPNLDDIFNNCPYTELEASGTIVGLPEGQMGNSEVGHMNIGAGRIVYQDLTYINKCISDNTFQNNKKLCTAMETVLRNDSCLHIMGLVSDGGIHSDVKHLYEILKLASKYNLKKVYVHAWTDGRDTAISSAKDYVTELEKFMSELGTGEIATICGRFYSMDRDKRNERTEQAYECMVNAKGKKFKESFKFIEESYNAEITDEFIKPGVKENYEGIKKDDVIICFNFRADRARQITQKFLKQDNKFYLVDKNKIEDYICFSRYDDNFKCNIAFEPREVKNTIGEYLSKCGLNQLRIAETEKYAHVTFFLNAGAEFPFKNEDRIIIDSPKVETYDLSPEMSADKITETVIRNIKSNKYNVIFVNYANPDMVGHTGNIDATIKAVEKVDECIGKIISSIKEKSGIAIITADHGNAEKMINSNGNPFTSHTCNLVPFSVYGYECKLSKSGALCDIAPTILEILEIDKPIEMTGKSLIKTI